MYLDNLNDEASTDLSMIQCKILGTLHEEDYRAGMWVYSDEWPGLGAIEESMDGATVYWQFRSDAELDTVTRICNMVGCYVYEHTRCSHVHDCCGCLFLGGIDAAVMYPRSDEKTYVIVERWGRNV